MQKDLQEFEDFEKYVTAQEIRRQANEAERIAKDEKRDAIYGSNSTYITIKDLSGTVRKVGVDESGCLTVDGIKETDLLPLATQTQNGMMSAEDKVKLDSLPEEKIDDKWIDNNLTID